MKNTNMRRRVLPFGAALCCIALSGCIVAMHSSRSEPGEPGWSSWDAVGRIQRGHTPRRSVIDRLGAPDSAYVNEDGNEELRWLLRRVEESDVSVLLYVEIEDGVVGRFWVE